jgi:hypothetical protein
VAAGDAGVPYTQDETTVLLSEAALPAERAGVLTRGAFLAGTSHPMHASPVLRGVYVRERLLCLPPLSPPDAVPAIGATTQDWTTNRERYAQHTADVTCAGCHVAIDGTGFVFENYDGVGAWRDLDNGQPVDASGELIGTDRDGPLADAIDLTETLAGSRQVHDCATTQLFRYAMHRTESEVDADTLEALREEFWQDDGTLTGLVLDLVTSDAFLTRRLP